MPNLLEPALPAPSTVHRKTQASLDAAMLFSCLLNHRGTARQVHRLFLQAIRTALDLGLYDLAEDYVAAWRMFSLSYPDSPPARQATPDARSLAGAA